MTDELRDALAFIAIALTIAAGLAACDNSQKPSSITPATNQTTEPNKEVGFSENKSLTLTRGIITVGMTSDDFVEILPAGDGCVNQEVKPDPKSQNSLLITKDCNVDGAEFIVVLARVQDPGPYRIISILTK
jgi:hypothetical protein